MNIAKKIGKIAFLLSLIIFNISFAKERKEIEWKISYDDKKIDEVEVLVPFELAIEINDYNSTAEPKFDLLKHLIVLRKFDPEQIFTTFNQYSHRKTIYKFLVAAPKTSFFNLGPIKLKLGDTDYESSDVAFNVVDKKKIENNDIDFHISVNKNAAYVGEKINFKVHFEAPEDVALEQILSDENKYFVTSKLRENSFTKMVDGKLKKVFEVEGNLYIEKPGLTMIPPKIAKYVEERRVNNFFHLIMPTFNKKELYSNILIINVLPLPKNIDVDSVGGIGQFNSYDLVVSATIAPRAMPISLKLTIEGEGNTERISWPKVELPENLRAIPSVENFDKNNSRKTFEYILQGLKEGTYHIEPQKFIYFDPNTKQTRTLVTNPVNITIEPSNVQTVQMENIDEQKELAENPPKELQDTIWFLRMPASLFWILFLFPVIWILLQIMILCRQIFLPQLIRFINKKIAFIKARSCVKKNIKLKRLDLIYDCFINLFTNRLNVNEQEITNDFIVNKLKAASIDENTLNNWQKFFSQISGLKFSKDIIYEHNLNQDSLFWLKKLEFYI